MAEMRDAPEANTPLTDADLARIEKCLPPIADDGDSSFAVGPLGFVGEAEEPSAEFDTDDVHRLINDVRELRRALLAHHESVDEYQCLQCDRITGGPLTTDPAQP